MKLHKSKFIAVTSLIGLMLLSSLGNAHGWSEYPVARQQACYEQGNIWSGTPPNAACAAAKSVSGYYPFVQRNEFSINVPDYRDPQAVRRAVPDGTLCYANDAQKRGLGLGRPDWNRTEISPGNFEYIFNATAPHNPSFWEFYLTKPDANLSQPLAWSDLVLLQTTGDVPVLDGKYRIPLSIPSHRRGDAILFVRWQRVDAAGEGFYNCSDITIVEANDTGGPTPPTSQPYLYQGDRFIDLGISHNSVSVGDKVTYTVYNRHGEQHHQFSLVITQDNRNDWDRLLAAQVNGFYETRHNGNVFIGRWHDDMQHYMYFKNDLHNNYFNSRNQHASGDLSITQAAQPSASAEIKIGAVTPLDTLSVQHGTVVILQPIIKGADTNAAVWTQTSGERVNMSTTTQNILVVDTASISSDAQTLVFRLTIPGTSVHSEVSLQITSGDTSEPPPNRASNWDVEAVYTRGDKVMHAGREWTAQWWTRGDEPGTTGRWGVWR